jgi:hypothetical protein
MKKRFTSGRISLGEIQVSKIFWQIAAISGTQQISSRQLKERETILLSENGQRVFGGKKKL